MQPYKTCKLFGALRVVLGIKDGVALLHSPRGCAYNLRYLLSVRGAEVSRILTSEMDEKDVIFGGGARLRGAIAAIDRKYNPALIAVLTSCASSIIGEDIEKICRNIKESEGINASLLPIHSGGFEGDQIDGYREAMRKMVELVEPAEGEREGANLLAIYRYGWDLEEVKRLVGFVTSTNSVLTAGATLREIKRASSAGLNIVMCEASGFDAARLMRERFEIPYIHPLLPIGVKATGDFVSSLSEFFEKEIPDKFMKEKRVAQREIERVREKVSGRRVCVISGASRIAPVTQFMCELGLEVVMVSIDRPGETTVEDLKRLEAELNIGPRVVIEPEVQEVLAAIEEERPDLVVGGMYEAEISRRFGIPLLDIMHGEEKTMGFEGAVNLARKVEVALSPSKS